MRKTYTFLITMLLVSVTLTSGCTKTYSPANPKISEVGLQKNNILVGQDTRSHILIVNEGELGSESLRLKIYSVHNNGAKTLLKDKLLGNLNGMDSKLHYFDFYVGTLSGINSLYFELVGNRLYDSRYLYLWE